MEQKENTLSLIRSRLIISVFRTLKQHHLAVMAASLIQWMQRTILTSNHSYNTKKKEFGLKSFFASSQLPVAAHVHGHAATLFDPLHFAVSEGRLQVGALQLHGELRDAVRPAEGARLKGFLRLVVAFPPGARGVGPALARAGAHVAGDVEGVALAVAKAVDHRAAAAALLADGLAQRLRLAPVSAQVAALGHHQGLPAGGQHLGFLLQQPVVALQGQVPFGLVRRRDGALRTGLLALRGDAEHPSQYDWDRYSPQHSLTAALAQMVKCGGCSQGMLSTFRGPCVRFQVLVSMTT